MSKFLIILNILLFQKRNDIFVFKQLLKRKGTRKYVMISGKNCF